MLLTYSSFYSSQGRITVVSQEMCRAILLGSQGLRRRGRGSSDLALFWSRRECHAHQAVPLRPHKVGDAPDYVLRLCDNCRQCARRLSETRRERYSTYIFLYVLHQRPDHGFSDLPLSLLLTLSVSHLGVMSIPASIVVSKLRYPEEEETTSSEKLSLASIEDARQDAGNWMHAFTNGAWLGVRLAGIVVAVLACVIAGVDLVDAILTWAGSYLNIENLTLEMIFGYLFVPVAFFLGIPNKELVLVGRLIAVKFLKVSHRNLSVFIKEDKANLHISKIFLLIPTTQNEFLAYEQLQFGYDYFRLTDRSRIISTYALCGFGNLGSLGTQVGLMTQMAPSRNKDIANVAFSAFITGVIATITSANMVGMLLGSDTAAAMIAASKATAPGPPPGAAPPPPPS